MHAAMCCCVVGEDKLVKCMVTALHLVNPVGLGKLKGHDWDYHSQHPKKLNRVSSGI
jgi:hypothetical protein